MKDLIEKFVEKNISGSGNAAGADPTAGGKLQQRNWYADQNQAVTTQRNWLFAITILSLVGLVISVGAVMYYQDKQVFQPFVIEVEDKTGIITKVPVNSAEKYTSDKALINSFAVQYIQAREGFSAATYQHDYNTVVRMFSARDVLSAFRGEIDEDNPNSPLKNIHTTKREVDIKSISHLKRPTPEDPPRLEVEIAIREYKMPDYNLISRKQYIVRMNYTFIEQNMNPSQRYINPLGFKVLSYDKYLKGSQVQ